MQSRERQQQQQRLRSSSGSSAALLPPLLVLLVLLQLVPSSSSSASPASPASSPPAAASPPAAPSPPVWPERFTSLMLQNRTNRLALVTLAYDWKLGANLNLIASQLGKEGTVYDLEWNNGTSFIFSRDKPLCKVMHFDVGILTPDWLAGSKYLGQTATDNFVTDVFTKAEFINYYADTETGLPVRWTFLWSGAEFHTLEWHEGEALPKDMWQAPAYCFHPPAPAGDEPSPLDNPLASGRIMRLSAADATPTPAAASGHKQPQQQAAKLATS